RQLRCRALRQDPIRAQYPAHHTDPPYKSLESDYSKHHAHRVATLFLWNWGAVWDRRFEPYILHIADTGEKNDLGCWAHDRNTYRLKPNSGSGEVERRPLVCCPGPAWPLDYRIRREQRLVHRWFRRTSRR